MYGPNSMPAGSMTSLWRSTAPVVMVRLTLAREVPEVRRRPNDLARSSSWRCRRVRIGFASS